MKLEIQAYMKENLGIDDQETFDMLYESFQETVAENLDKLAEVIASDDREGIRSAAHALKGCAGNIGAEKIREISYRMEMAAKNGDVSPCAELLEQLHGLKAQL